MAKDQKWEKLDIFRMSDEDADAVIDAATGCAATWVRPDGHPLAVWISHVRLDGEIYVTSTENRPKTTAWLADNRTSLVFGVTGMGAVTVVGRVELRDDAALRLRFLEALADKMGLSGTPRENWLSAMNSEGRLVGRVVRERTISFDERKLAVLSNGIDERSRQQSRRIHQTTDGRGR